MLPAFNWSSLGSTVGATKKSGFAVGKEGSEVKERPYGFSYSMIGECTEHDLNTALNGGMLRDGRLSRFLCVRGDDMLRIGTKSMPPMPATLKTMFTTIVGKSVVDDSWELVDVDVEGKMLLDKYNFESIKRLNEMRDISQEAMRVVYGRAHFKVWRIAGALAVADNPQQPHITAPHVLWAIGIVNRDINMTITKIINREIGDSASVSDQVLKIKELICTWLANGQYDLVRHQRAYGKALKEQYVAIKPIREAIQGLPMFVNKRSGKFEVADLTSALNILVAEGFLSREPVTVTMPKFGIKGAMFFVSLDASV